MLKPGDPYPKFELPDHRGNLVSTAGLRGRWFVLYWYPKADTPGCTAQATGLRDQIEAFDELGCAVLGASFDSPDQNDKFRTKYRLSFPLLSDVRGDLALSVGAAEDGAAEHPRRIAHLVDGSGTVVRRYEVDDPSFFAECVLDHLEDSQFPAEPDEQP